MSRQTLFCHLLCYYTFTLATAIRSSLRSSWSLSSLSSWHVEAEVTWKIAHDLRRSLDFRKQKQDHLSSSYTSCYVLCLQNIPRVADVFFRFMHESDVNCHDACLSLICDISGLTISDTMEFPMRLK